MRVRQVSSPPGTGQSPRLPPRGRLPYGLGIFASFLAIVLLLVVGGLLVADRAIEANFRGIVRRDADATAMAVERYVTERRGSLREFRGIFAPPDSLTAEAFRAVGETIMRERPALARVWLESPDGAVLFDTLVAGATPDGSRALLLREPLVLRDSLVGFAAGVFNQTALVNHVEEAAPPTRRSAVLLSGSDTLLGAIRSPQGVRGVLRPVIRTERREIRLASGEEWRLELTHAHNTNNIRAALWLIGLLAVSFLVAGLVRERRDAARVDERSHELERLSAELLRANRMKSEFLANVSHELRTPLNALVGFVDLLRDGVYGELTPRQAQPVERVAASAAHLRHLVDQILDIAKLAAGRLEVHPETVALRPFVLEVAAELEPLIAEKGLTLSLTVGASLPRVRTDPTHLRQVLVNLVGNAVKFTPSGGISVRAKLLDPAQPEPENEPVARQSPDPGRTWVALLVTDTGIGIAPADHSRIFDEFEQVNPGPRGDSSERGTGLGLPISRRLARLLGGDLTLDSDVGRGATFILWLPVDPAQLNASGQPSQEDASTGSRQSSPAPT